MRRYVKHIRSHFRRLPEYNTHNSSAHRGREGNRHGVRKVGWVKRKLPEPHKINKRWAYRSSRHPLGSTTNCQTSHHDARFPSREGNSKPVQSRRTIQKKRSISQIQRQKSRSAHSHRKQTSPRLSHRSSPDAPPPQVQPRPPNSSPSAPS